jgi:ubiquinone/menaquinone biosynthesis C-methylase UbiE
MKKWILKAFVQKIISFLPHRHKINYFFQKYITKGVFLTEEYFLDRLQHAKNHIEAFQKHISSIEGKTTLELGTGWYPVVPISLFLSGADNIYTVDISNLCDKKNLQTTIKMFVDYHEKGALKSFLTPLPSRVEILQDLHESEGHLSQKEMLSKLNMSYWVENAQNLPLENETIDLVHSNNTFEHVYPEVLIGLLMEFKRIVKKNGLMSHFVDMSDHFAHFDKSITIYNFLKFSEKQWVLIDNAVQPQNRWRLPEFLHLYKDLELDVFEVIIREGSVETLKNVNINEKFKEMTLEEIAVSHCLLISGTH